MDVLSPVWGLAFFVDRSEEGVYGWAGGRLQHSVVNEAFVETFMNYAEFTGTRKHRKSLGHYRGYIAFRFVTTEDVAHLTDESPLKVVWFEEDGPAECLSARQIVAYRLKDLHGEATPSMAIYGGPTARSFTDLLRLGRNYSYFTE